jgi:hypothetical protein
MRWAMFAMMSISLGLAVQSVPQPPAQANAPQVSAAQASGGARKIPCKVPENASMCYWTRGRLSYYLANPPYRVWKTGTKRILGIYSGPSVWPPKDQWDQDNPEFPANVKAAFDQLSNKLFADFEICPLEPERAGWMQHACIESAANIFVEK